MATTATFIPKYEKVQQAILQDIRSGKLNPGDKLPVREAMLEQYSATRTTIGKALSGLIDQGILTASPRHGTFVAEKKMLQRVALVSWENSIIQHSNSFGDRYNYFSLYGSLLKEIQGIEIVNADAVSKDSQILKGYDYILWSALPLETLNRVVKELDCRDKIILLNRAYENFSFASTNHREASRRLTEMFLAHLPAESIFYFLDITTSLPGLSYVIKERKKGFLEACEKERRFYRFLDINISSFFNHNPDVAILNDIQMADAPAAIISPTMLLTGAVIRFMAENNLHLNQDIFYADFDNEYSVINTGYPIPTVLEDYMSIATAAIKIINSESTNQKYLIPSKIINNPFSKNSQPVTALQHKVVNF